MSAAVWMYFLGAMVRSHTSWVTREIRFNRNGCGLSEAGDGLFDRVVRVLFLFVLLHLFQWVLALS